MYRRKRASERASERASVADSSVTDGKHLLGVCFIFPIPLTCCFLFPVSRRPRLIPPPETRYSWEPLPPSIVPHLEALRKRGESSASFQNRGSYPPTSFRIDMLEATMTDLRSRQARGVRRWPPLVAGTLLTGSETAAKQEIQAAEEAAKAAEEAERRKQQQIRDQKVCGYGPCKRKLKLSDVVCRCDLRFCALHRQAETHECVFDYRQDGKGRLRKLLPGGGKFDRFGPDAERL